MRGDHRGGSLPRSVLAHSVTFSPLSPPWLPTGQRQEFRCRPVPPSSSVPTCSSEIKDVRRKASYILNSRLRMERSLLEISVPRIHPTPPLPTPPRTWFCAPRPCPSQDKGQAESTGRRSTDRLHHRGPWRAEQQQRRSIVMCDQVRGEVTGTVSGVGVSRATQKTGRTLPVLLAPTWTKDSPRSCLTELTARLLKSCQRVETVMAGRSPQPIQQVGI
jgi:hypothetical protein